MADASCGYSDIGCWLTWVQDEVKGFFVWIAEQVFNAILSVFAAIPVPDWAQAGADIFSSIPAGVGYFVGPFDLSYAAVVLSGAYGTRFLIRRIPLIG